MDFMYWSLLGVYSWQRCVIYVKTKHIGIYQTRWVNRGEGKWMLHGHVRGSWTLQVLLISAVMFSNYFRLSVQKYKPQRRGKWPCSHISAVLSSYDLLLPLCLSFLSFLIFPFFSLFYSFLLIVLQTTFFLSSSSFKYFYHSLFFSIILFHFFVSPLKFYFCYFIDLFVWLYCLISVFSSLV
jgi:hypothetical protein